MIQRVLFLISAWALVFLIIGRSQQFLSTFFFSQTQFRSITLPVNVNTTANHSAIQSHSNYYYSTPERERYNGLDTDTHHQNFALTKKQIVSDEDFDLIIWYRSKVPASTQVSTSAPENETEFLVTREFISTLKFSPTGDEVPRLISEAAIKVVRKKSQRQRQTIRMKMISQKILERCLSIPSKGRRGRLG